MTKNNQIFRQRIGASGAENTQLKSNLEEAQKESAAIGKERDALKAAAITEAPTSSEPLAEEPERLQHEKGSLLWSWLCRKDKRSGLYKRRRPRQTRPVSS